METAVKNPPANPGDVRVAGLIPGLGRSPGGGQGNPLQYSCLENPMDRGAWEATAHGVTKSQTRLSTFTQSFLSWNTFPKKTDSPSLPLLQLIDM